MADEFDPSYDFNASDYEYIETQDTDSWDIEMQDPDGWKIQGILIPPEETPFNDNLPEVPGTPVSLAKREKIESFYKYLEDNGYEVDKNAPIEREAVFKINIDKELAITYKNKTIKLTQEKNSKLFLRPTTIASRYGKDGVPFVRNVPGIKNYNKPRLETLPIINEAIASTKNIGIQTVERVQEDLNKFLETSTQTELTLDPEGSFTYRELSGIGRSLGNMRNHVESLIGERDAKKARVRELKDETSRVAYNNEEVQFDENLRKKQKEINTLEEEIAVLDSQIREYDGKFRSQFKHIKQTIDKMFNKDMTLGERIQTLFREQGSTIASILTAFGLAITVIVQNITKNIKAATPNPKPKPTPKPTPEPTPKPIGLKKC